LRQGSLFSKAVALIVTALLIVFGLMFSVILLAIIVTAGFLAFCYLWWKTRAVRRQMRRQMSRQTMDGTANEAEVFKGEVIEGEVISRVVIRDAIER
jgi:ABC-type bacteriocin/lantibiotic exporter with double-glycine peptidase domain